MQLIIHNDATLPSKLALLVWLFFSIFTLQAVPPVLAGAQHRHGNLSRCPARLVTTKTITVTRSTAHATPIPDANTVFDAKSRTVTTTTTTTTTTKFILKTKTVNKDRFRTSSLSVDREEVYPATTQNKGINSASRYSTAVLVDSDMYPSSNSEINSEKPNPPPSMISPVDTLLADSPSSSSLSSSSPSTTDTRTQVTSYAPSSSSSSSSASLSSSASTSSLIIPSSSLSPIPATPPLSTMQTCEISVYTYAPASECTNTYNTVGACGLSTYFPETMSSKLPRLAVPMALFDQYGASQHNTLCGKTVTIKGANGYTGKAIIADRNAGTSFDLCMDLWTDLGYTSGGGRFAAQYVFD